jgi:tetratricopeptide (TPR) repeat protein
LRGFARSDTGVSRSLTAALAGGVLALLIAVQVTSSAALRDYAQPGSLLLLLPHDLADRVAFAAGDRLTPALKLLLARRAMNDGDLELAELRVAALPASRDRAALAGQIFERRGDHAQAIRSFLVAGDLPGLEREEQLVERSGNISRAVALQREIVSGLARDRTQPDALAEAWWRLGLVEETDAYHHPIPARRPYALRSMRAYEQAVALAPLSEKYLIAAGSQELNLGEAARALIYFERARDVDPTSAQAWIGLGEVALYRGDRAAARRYLARARRIDPTTPAVLRLDAKLRT